MAFSVYLIQTNHGFDVPTGKGFYVQREARYRPQDAEEVVRLSKAAWKIYDPLYGTKVIGLFRERSKEREIATLYRIVWYPDLATWKKTRLPDKRPKVQEVRRIFKTRSALQLHEDIGPARATDRAIP